jgi:hypothetical protein
MTFTPVVRANSIRGLVLLMALAACSPTGTTAGTTTVDPIPSTSGSLPTTTEPFPSTTISRTPTMSVSDAAREWDDQGIDDYTLAYSINNMNGMGGADYDGVYSFEVRDGQVTECVVTELGENAALPDDICDNRTSPIDFLFSWVDRFDPRHTSVEYDSESHLPTRVIYDDPQTADEEYTIRLLRFDNLETSP